MPRPYGKRRRAAAQAETERRIIEATVALHAERGVLATRYADIAARAGVAPQTVYNRFPGRAELLAACTGAVAAKAPPLGPELFERATDPAARLEALVHALARHYAFIAPWARWGLREAPALPELATAMAEWRRRIDGLIQAAVAPAFDGTPPADLAALLAALLAFESWDMLAARLGAEPATDALAEAAAALLERHRWLAVRARLAQAAGRRPRTTEPNQEEPRP